MTEHGTDHVWILVGDYGPNRGGWGPMYIATMVGEGVAVYTGDDPFALEGFKAVAATSVACGAVREARLLRFENPEVVWEITSLASRSDQNGG